MLNVSALFIPIFLLFVLIEWYISYRKKDNTYVSGNTVMNFTIGAIDQIGSLISFVLLFVVMEYVYNHYRIIENTNIWYQWVGGYFAVDFLSYWYHRWSHRVNILWAGHITHHSSEHFNFSNGFRTSFFQGINRIIFWAFLPLFGFSPIILIVIFKVSGLYDFLQHSAYIPKLKYIDKILVTPSAHRVHHGKNEIYIDKNYGSNFIIWDRLFGTYSDETEPVKFGITSAYVDNNPVTAIGGHYKFLWQTMLRTPSWSDKIKLWFMPPEWKPTTMRPISPPATSSATPVSNNLIHYAYFQLISCIAGIILLLVFKDFLSIMEISVISLVAISSMVNVTLIFNRNVSKNFEKQETLRIMVGFLLVLINSYLSTDNYLWPITLFLSVSLIFIFILSYFTNHENSISGSH